jgi:hypothetical protein
MKAGRGWFYYWIWLYKDAAPTALQKMAVNLRTPDAGAMIGCSDFAKRMDRGGLSTALARVKTVVRWKWIRRGVESDSRGGCGPQIENRTVTPSSRIRFCNMDTRERRQRAAAVQNLAKIRSALIMNEVFWSAATCRPLKAHVRAVRIVAADVNRLKFKSERIKVRYYVSTCFDNTHDWIYHRLHAKTQGVIRDVLSSEERENRSQQL